jgi:hypothetical protein
MVALPALIYLASSGTRHVIQGVQIVERLIVVGLGPSLSSFFSVLSVITLVEYALPGTSLLTGEPLHLVVPWVTLSVSLNVVVTSMICFRLLRMRALMREVLSPEMSRMYTSIAAMLIESAAPFSVLGIGLVITAALKTLLVPAFGYVWTMFCVESQPSPCLSIPQMQI